MDIPTFGALLRFAAELEEEHQDIFKKAAEKATSESIKNELLELAQQNQKTQELMEKLYRDSIRSDMDTGFQEPIPGLNRSDYLDEDKKIPAELKAILKTAKQFEEHSQRFYNDASLQTKGKWSAVARSMDKVFKEKTERIGRLEQLLKLI